MMILLIDNNAKNSTIDHFKVIFREFGQSYDIKNSYEAITPDQLGSYTGVIASGGPWDLTRPLLLGNFKLDLQVMINARVPYYGICMGHQIMSESNGSSIDQWPEEYHGWREVRILEKSGLFRGLDNTIRVMEWHQEYVVEPAPGFELIATSEACYVQGTTHPSRHFYSTQFHPELSGEVGRKIINNFLDICNQVKN